MDNKDRYQLVKLFQTTKHKFYEFVSEHPDIFVAVAVDIMLDKTADSEEETALERMLFHELRSSKELWTDLETSLKNDLKNKLLNGIDELEGSEKMLILAHVIGIITTFEEWPELIPKLTDLNSSKDGKLKMLRMIAGWSPVRLKVDSLQILKVIYDETLKIDETDFDSFQLFMIMEPTVKNVNDVPLLIKVAKITAIFLLKSYVTNYEQLKLFDTGLNLNMNITKNTFNEMQCNIEESFDRAKLCLGILHDIQFHHFDAMQNELKDAMFFLSNMFLQISASKIKFGLIEFTVPQNEWGEEEWHFACVANNIFSFFVGWEEKSDYFSRYFKDMNDDYNFVENIVSNTNYEIDESICSFWPHVLHQLAKSHVYYFWDRKDLFVPLLQQQSCPALAYQDMVEFKNKLCQPERSAVEWFVRNNYSRLYDKIHIPIVEIILKYLSEYVSIDIVKAYSDDHEKETDYSSIIISKQNHNLLQETVEAVANTLNDQEIPNKIIKEIYSFLSYSESTMQQEIMSNCILCPIVDQEIPCIIISAPTQSKTRISSVTYNLSSIELKLGWFECAKEDKEKWPKGGKYYICIQEFDVTNPLEPNNKINKILFKSKIFTVTTQDYEICKVYDINLKLNNATFYTVYMVQLDPTLNEEQMNESYKENNTDYSIVSTIDYYADQTSVYFKKAISLPCTDKTKYDADMLMTTFLYYNIKNKQYRYSYGFSSLYDITFNCV